MHGAPFLIIFGECVTHFIFLLRIFILRPPNFDFLFLLRVDRKENSMEYTACGFTKEHSEICVRL